MYLVNDIEIFLAGKWKLQPQYSEKFYKGGKWDKMKPQNKERFLTRFYKGPLPKPETVTSRNEELTLPKRPKTMKKPHQVFTVQSFFSNCGYSFL